MLIAPLLCQLLAFVTSTAMTEKPFLSHLLPKCGADVGECAKSIFNAAISGAPTLDAVKFLACFMGIALLLDRLLPGKIQTGPMTLTGHIPQYIDNGTKHVLIFPALFLAGSNIGYFAWYDFGIIYDVFVPSVTILNLFGVVLCVFLMYKGLHFPSTEDNGSSGSYMKDYLWGTELYPRVCGVDIKRFINCRFSMTFWMLAGLSFTYRSYTLHNTVDYGLLFSSISQYMYLVKFFWWEMGYMRSIDIIVDRAGFEIQWGCLVFVPSLYTLHTRFLVKNPSSLPLPIAFAIFAIGFLGVVFNYLADAEKDRFRATNGKCLVWGKVPTYITAQYQTKDNKTVRSLLLASGFWGVARHFQYFFELVAAWSWCLLANPLNNGVIPLFYATFLTCLLIDRAKRDETKCRLKYGKYYDDYCKLVPYHILPGIY